MKYRNLGRSGVKVSALCLGMMSYGTNSWAPWVLDKSEARKFVAQALDSGINFFDTADFYSYGASEEALAEATSGICKREQLVIGTKVGGYMGPGPNERGSSRKHIREGIDASLRRLRTDYVDIYMLHVWDGVTEIEETISALDDLVRAGKILYYGASNFLAWQLAKAQRYARDLPGGGFSCMQIQYNLLSREDERDLLPLCADEGVGITVYSPLARGWLLEKPGAQMTAREQTRSKQDARTGVLYGSDSDSAVRERLHELATRRGLPPGRIALAWLHSHPQVSSILIGALEPSHLSEAQLSLDLILTADEIRYLEEPYVPGSLKTGGLQEVLARQTKES